MLNETGKELHVSLERKDCENLNYEQIRTELIRKAIAEKLHPIDRNYRGFPNVYLRGKYAVDSNGIKTLIGDIFIMFVKEDNVGSINDSN